MTSYSCRPGERGADEIAAILYGYRMRKKRQPLKNNIPDRIETGRGRGGGGHKSPREGQRRKRVCRLHFLHHLTQFHVNSILSTSSSSATSPPVLSPLRLYNQLQFTRHSDAHLTSSINWAPCDSPVPLLVLPVKVNPIPLTPDSPPHHIPLEPPHPPPP